MTEPVAALIVISFGLIAAWLILKTLAAIWRSFSLDATARKAGELASRVESAYKDGRSRP